MSSAEPAGRRMHRIMIGVLLVVLLLGGGWLWTPDLDRAAVEARYARSSADFVEVAGLRLHIRDDGPRDAPALILLHGFGSSLHTWESWVPSLARRYRVVRFDLPGAGLTGADPGGDYSDERGAAILTTLMDRLGLRRATFVGHSMGGRLAWRFAAASPERLDRLVLIAPDGFASPGFTYGKPPDVTPMVRLMKYVLPRAVLRMSLEPAFADPAMMTEDLVTRYHDLMRAPTVRSALIARMEQTVLRDPVPLLAGISAPTLLIWGDRDAMIPVANADDYLRALPGAVLVRLPDVGHLPHEEAPEASLRLLEAFLGA